MPLELIFTSVPKGVKPGSSGYCTVAKHKGIDRLLDQAVEKICYYELMNHPAKPVVCAYRIMNLNTGVFHVLTRTVYSGSDHTGRTNYISHNLIFDQKEALSQNVSPADIFLNGSGWLDNWPSGQSPAYLKDGICQISFPSGSATSKPLALWEKITGQGILAHELLNHDKWKFLTESGDHLLMLSLLSEFAQADNNSLRASWGQLTFVTYLQPTENPDDFNIIGGDSSVQKFGTLVCSTLNLSSSTGPQFCFSENWSGGAFGPVPKEREQRGRVQLVLIRLPRLTMAVQVFPIQIMPQSRFLRLQDLKYLFLQVLILSLLFPLYLERGKSHLKKASHKTAI